MAILDIDFHHGNGTQDIFYDRADVLFVSLHSVPEGGYSWLTGYADERGRGAGDGTSVNYPLPPKTGFDRWSEALDDAICHISASVPDAIVVSLGVDADKDEPISFFRLDSPDFADAGRWVATLGLPTLFVMVGGYAIEQVGINTANVLEGFAGA